MVLFLTSVKSVKSRLKSHSTDNKQCYLPSVTLAKEGNFLGSNPIYLKNFAPPDG